MRRCAGAQTNHPAPHPRRTPSHQKTTPGHWPGVVSARGCQEPDGLAAGLARPESAGLESTPEADGLVTAPDGLAVPAGVLHAARAPTRARASRRRLNMKR